MSINAVKQAIAFAKGKAFHLLVFVGGGEAPFQGIVDDRSVNETTGVVTLYVRRREPGLIPVFIDASKISAVTVEIEGRVSGG